MTKVERKKIPLKDKALVRKRLARGDSYREAIKGTAVKSPATAKRIAEEEVNSIEQIRVRYLQLIESFDAGELDRARLWAEMTRAERVNKFGAVLPDWANREKALKYIDSLAGIDVEGGPEGQQQNQFNFFNIPPEKLREYQDKALEAILR